MFIIKFQFNYVHFQFSFLTLWSWKL